VFHWLFRLRLLWALTVVGFASSFTEGLAQPPGVLPMQAVRLRDVTLHYVAVGRGEPVVMVHGGLEDYRLTPQLAHWRPIIAPSPIVVATFPESQPDPGRGILFGASGRGRPRDADR
jgi:hypothetical protein